ncbi:DUF423 domain-containing protein [Laspinema olomoucense]|uniref:DUF423 domain-containing protein n=1 Tax=Laspinema olomoucense D3b TaxID=2953688 RepID=A0ABT2ND01_9CYAN|nr:MULTISPECIES: DUF423 domain-containing protein [unclassified Laspinema]MCT7975303.1 DUF423 domain-containing protein [Laspinema sp. D3d]MCT7980574.1 DUF423 domain-containing protein [Laspinema sp. D3b]MCT7991155.1 DUF423 domain-containing protein [Laspinema sp. D3a]
MAQLFMVTASILAGLSVAAGAFASHALKPQLSERAIEIFETGARYQMYHALALLFVGLMVTQTEIPSIWLRVAGFAFIAGVFIFSGSLYTLSLSGIKWLGAITPIGGAAFLLGWGCLAVATWKM